MSGDYCDVIPPTRENAGLMFLLGDVSGKGVAASLLMTHLHATFRSLACMGLELSELLTIANRIFCESTPPTMYATLACGRVAPDGELEIASAGHLPGLLVSQSGVEQILATGFPLGLFPATQYTVHRVRLQHGDSLLLYTDGISEARDRSGNEFGIDGLSVAVSGLHGLSAEALVSACHETVDQFSCRQRPSDDQTLMAVTYEGVL